MKARNARNVAITAVLAGAASLLFLASQSTYGAVRLLGEAWCSIASGMFLSALVATVAKWDSGGCAGCVALEKERESLRQALIEGEHDR